MKKELEDIEMRMNIIDNLIKSSNIRFALNGQKDYQTTCDLINKSCQLTFEHIKLQHNYLQTLNF